MVVTARAFERQPEKGRAHRVDAVDDVGDAKLLGDDPALFVLHVQPIERRRQALLLRRIGQQIARQLPADELPIRQVAIERRDDPVAIRVDRPVAVHLIPVRVGVPGDIEPVDRHPLAIPGRGKQPVDHRLVGCWRLISDKRRDLFGRGRQAGQIERGAPQPGFPRRLGRGGQPLLLQLGQYKSIDRLPHPIGLSHVGGGRLGHRLKRPVPAPLRPLGHPVAQQPLLFVRQRPIERRRRHDRRRVGLFDPRDQFTLVRLPRHNRRVIAQTRLGGVFLIEPQPGLASHLRRPMTMKAGIRQDRQNVTTEVDLLGPRSKCTPAG